VRPRGPRDWFPRRGEIYLARIDKLRPAVVISTNALNRYALDVCVVPLTSVEHAAFLVRVPIPAKEGGLSFASWAKCDSVTTVPKTSLEHPPMGSVTAETLARIEIGVKRALGLR